MKILKIDIHPYYQQYYYRNEDLFQEWIFEAAMNSDIYLEKGSAEGMRVGDLLIPIYRHELKNEQGRLISESIEKDQNLLKVVDVQRDFCIARIESFAYKVYFQRYLASRLAQAGQSPEFMMLFPLLVGQEVLPVSRTESQEWNKIDRLYAQLTGDPQVVSAKDATVYRKIVEACRIFMEKHDNNESHFLSNAYYQKGFALHKLKRYQESNDVFNSYLKRFPKQSGEEGALNWISENNLHLEQILDKQRIGILFLAANPIGNEVLRLDQEVRDLESELKKTEKGRRFDLVQKWAVTTKDLRDALTEREWWILHFSGHGSQEGIALEDSDGAARYVSSKALADIIGLLGEHIECVVLNACNSLYQAKEIVKHIPNVIGMSADFPDQDSIIFSTGFYSGIGMGLSIDKAFKLALNALELEDRSSFGIPRLLTNDDQYNI